MPNDLSRNQDLALIALLNNTTVKQAAAEWITVLATA